MNQLPLFVTIRGKPVILLGEGDAADAKRRLIERAGGLCVDAENADALLAFVAIEDRDIAETFHPRRALQRGAAPRVPAHLEVLEGRLGEAHGAAAGLEPLPSTPEQLAQLIRTETTKWAKVIKDSGAKLD